MVKRLSVGIVTSTFPFGFGEAFLHDEIEALTRLGCELTVFPAAARRMPNSHADLQIPVIKFALLSPRTLLCGLRGLRRNVRSALGALRMILRSNNRFWTKIKNLLLFPTGLALADMASELQLDHIHAYWLSGPATVALVASKVSGIGWSYSAHSWDIFMEDNLIKEKSRAATFGRTISELGRQRLIRYSSRDAAAIETIHLGVRIPHATAVSKRESKEFRILCPAYFIPVKGHKYLLEGLRYALDLGFPCRCTLAGDGPLRSELEDLTKELGLDRLILMPGMVSHKELLGQLSGHEFDAVVLASVEIGSEFEGIPVSLMEAMAAGIPCIATRTGAIPELIDNECGILVGQRDPRGLGDAIIALASDSRRRERLAQHALRRIAEQFNPTVSAHRLRALMSTRNTSALTTA